MRVSVLEFFPDSTRCLRWAEEQRVETMFEVMTGNRRRGDGRRDNHPVVWMLIESTSSGILQNNGRITSPGVGLEKRTHRKYHRHNSDPSRCPPNQ